MKEKEMRIVLVEPGKEAKITTIENTLEAKQKLVGGLIQPVYHFYDEDSVILICNEEGKFNGSEFNRAIFDNGKLVDLICGTFFFCCDDGEDFSSISEELAEKYKKRFLYPEIITQG